MMIGKKQMAFILALTIICSGIARADTIGDIEKSIQNDIQIASSNNADKGDREESDKSTERKDDAQDTTISNATLSNAKKDGVENKNKKDRDQIEKNETDKEQISRATSSNAEKDFFYKKTVGGYTITLEAEAGTFPDDVKAKIKKVEEIDDTEIEAILEEQLSEKEQIERIAAFDISFWSGETEIEPEAGTVLVKIRAPQSREINTEQDTKVFHIIQENMVEEVACEITEKGEISYEAVSFSVYGVVLYTTDSVSINTPEEFLDILNGDGDYILEADLDFSGIEWPNPSVIPGEYVRYFSGSIDGNNHKLTNIEIVLNGSGESAGGYEYEGIFSRLNGAEIKNLIIENVSIQTGNETSGNIYAGILAGEVSQSTIENCSINQVSVKLQGNEGIQFGGIAGACRDSQIVNCNVDGEINIEGDGDAIDLLYIGGICAEIQAADISQCFNAASLNAVSGGNINIGGISARIGSSDGDQRCSVMESYNCGNISVEEGSSVSIGGIAGNYFSYGSEKPGSVAIENCYNIGEMTDVHLSAGGKGYIGGILGSTSATYSSGVYGALMIEYCYNLGPIFGEGYNSEINQGNIIGRIEDGAFGEDLSFQAQYCYYYNNSGTAVFGKDDGGLLDTYAVNALNQYELEDTGFYRFDFEAIWIEGHSGYLYPLLRWQEEIPSNPQLDFAKENVLTFGKDTFSFGNSGRSFSGLNQRYKDLLLNVAGTNTAKARLREAWKEIDDKGNPIRNGMCYGMSSSVILNWKKRIHPEKWQTWHEDTATYLCDLMSPEAAKSYVEKNNHMEDNEATTSLDMIAFYQLMNWIPKVRNHWGGYQSDILKEAVERAGEASNGGVPVLLCFEWKNLNWDPDSEDNDEEPVLGHAIAAYDLHIGSYMLDGENYLYRLSIYDPNCKNDAQYLYINGDYTTWKYDAIYKYTDYSRPLKKNEIRMYSATNDLSLIDPANPETDLLRNALSGIEEGYSHPFLITNNPRVTIENSIGDKIKVAELSADVEEPYYLLPSLEITEDATSNQEIIVVFSEEEAIEIIPDTETALDTEIIYSDIRFTAQSDGYGTAAFNPEGTVTLKNANGDEQPFALSLTVNETNEINMPWYTLMVQGSSSETASLVKAREGILISGDNLNDVNVTANDDYETVELTFSTEETQVLVCADAEKEKLEIRADLDNDGTFESVISKDDDSVDRPEDDADGYDEGDVSHGGSSGSGGGSSDSGSSTISTTTRQTLPSYVVKGSWEEIEQGRWILKNSHGERYRGQWVAAYNPYADPAKGQETYDWFRFDSDGYMLTGWFTDVDGRIYYLNPISDNTLGRMVTGWEWITGLDGLERCYYFETKSNGYRGSMYLESETPDGFEVNDKGEWIENGKVKVRENKAGNLDDGAI